MTSPKKYTFYNDCTFAPCRRVRRDTDIFCFTCYKSLPPALRHALFTYNPRALSEAIKNAKEYLQKQHDKAAAAPKEA